MSTLWEDIKEVSLAIIETAQDYLKDFWTTLHEGWVASFF